LWLGRSVVVVVGVGLASHWPHVTDIISTPRRAQGLAEGDEQAAYAVFVEYDELYLYFTFSGLTLCVGYYKKVHPIGQNLPSVCNPQRFSE